MTRKIIRKLSSRKFWMAAAGIVTGIAMALGVEQSDAASVAGAVTAAISVAAYVIAEGRVDAAALAEALEKTQRAGELLLPAKEEPAHGTGTDGT
jgi:hypothetical protein